MLKARRDPDDLINNVWIVTDEPELDPPKKSGLILPHRLTAEGIAERRLREETVHVYKATLPWTVDTEEEALAAVMNCKTEIEAQIAAETEEVLSPPVKDATPDPVSDAQEAKEATFDAVSAEAALDTAVTEGAKVLRDQLADDADKHLADEPQDLTVKRVLASLLVGEAGQLVRRQGLDRAALVAKLQERLPPKGAIIRP